MTLAVIETRRAETAGLGAQHESAISSKLPPRNPKGER